MPKKKFASDDPQHALWLQFGLNKLKSFKSSERTAKKTYVINELNIASRESADTVLVEVNPAKDEVTVLQIPPQYYFGFGAEVRMPCFCRKIVINPTTAGASVSARIGLLNISDGVQEWGVYVGENLVSTQTGTYFQHPIEGGAVDGSDLVNIADGLGIGFGIGGILNGWSNGGVVSTPLAEHPAFIAAKAQADALNAAAQAASQARFSISLTTGEEIARKLYDTGFGLVVAASGGDYHIAYYYSGSEVEPADLIKTDLVPTKWSGGAEIKYLEVFGSGPFTSVTRSLNITVPENVCFYELSPPPYPEAAPLRAAYSSGSYSVSQLSVPGSAGGQTGPYNMTVQIFDNGSLVSSVTYVGGGNITGDGVTSLTLSTQQYIFSFFGTQEISFRDYTFIIEAGIGTTMLSDSGYSIIDRPAVTAAAITAQGDADYAAAYAAWEAAAGANAAAWAAAWNAAQAEGRAREHVRRKACSDGQLMFLRNSFLSPSFESFIKLAARRSTVVKRKYPMTILQNSTVLTSLVVDGAVSVYTYTTTVRLSYIVTSGDTPVTHTETFVGAVVKTITQHTEVGDGAGIETITTREDVYTNYPALRTGASGQVIPLSSSIASDETEDVISIFNNRAIKHDLDTPVQYNPLFTIINGTIRTVDAWVVDDKLDLPAYNVTITTDPPLQAPLEQLVSTHPQFIYDYIQNSKPVAIQGAEVASTNWLSSKLSDGEIITVVPIVFINAEGVDRGMYPYDFGDEPPAKIRITGYAKVKYKYADASFSFISWTELTTDGKVTITDDSDFTYNDETTPTQLTVGDKTYVIDPKESPYLENWNGANCVCISSKVKWADLKTTYTSQKRRITPGYEVGTFPGEPVALTDEEQLYKAVLEAIK